MSPPCSAFTVSVGYPGGPVVFRGRPRAVRRPGYHDAWLILRQRLSCASPGSRRSTSGIWARWGPTCWRVPRIVSPRCSTTRWARSAPRLTSRATSRVTRAGIGPRRSVVTEGVDQLSLGHRGAALDADLPGPLDQVLLGPVVVGTALAALAAYLAERGG